MRNENIDKITAFCDYLITAPETQAEWNYDFALFGYSLFKLSDVLKDDRYLWFLRSFCDRALNEKPALNRPEDAAPALIIYEMYKKTGNSAYLSILRTASGFLKSPFDLSSGNLGGGVKKSGKQWFKTLRTQSLLTNACLKYLLAKLERDDGSAERAAALPALYASCLMDQNAKLFCRTYFPDLKLRLPLGKNFSSRENTTALYALSLLAEYEGYGRADTNKLIAELTKSILKYRNPDGSYRRLLIDKRKVRASGFLQNAENESVLKIKTQEPQQANQAPEAPEMFSELNVEIKEYDGDPGAAAFFAACCIKNALAGIIDREYLHIGERAFLYTLNSLTIENGVIYLRSDGPKKKASTLISGIFQTQDVKEKSALYDAAGLILAAIEFSKRPNAD